MTKNIIIGLLAAGCIFFAIYANIQSKEALAQTATAEANLELAKQHKMVAEKATKEAEKLAAQALHEKRLAELLREECEKLNK